MEIGENRDQSFASKETREAGGVIQSKCKGVRPSAGCWVHKSVNP